MIGRILGVLAMLVVLAGAAYYGVARSRLAPQGQSDGSGASIGQAATDAVPVRVIVFGERVSDSTQAVSVSRFVGIVQSERDVAISPKAPSRIGQIHVAEGDRVRAGQLLVTLDAGDLQAQLDAARAGVDAANAMLQKAVRGKLARQAELDAAVLEAESELVLATVKLKQADIGIPAEGDAARSDADKANAGVAQAKAGLQQAEVGLREAEDAVRRLEELHRHGGVADVDLESARSKAAMAHAAVESARAGLDMALASQKPAARAASVKAQIGEADLEAARTGQRLAEQAMRTARAARAEALRIADYDIAAARSQLRQAEAGYRQALASIGDGRLVSPVDGVVADLTGKPGEYAQPGMAIMRVVGSGPLRVVVSAPSRVASRLAPGASVRVFADVDQRNGILTSVAGIGRTANRDGRTVPIIIALPSRGHELKPGMAVTVEMAPSGSAESRSVPRAALRREREAWVAFILQDGRAVRRPVTLLTPAQASAPQSHVGVESGLRPGDRVICPLPDGIHDGARVRDTSL